MARYIGVIRSVTAIDSATAATSMAPITQRHFTKMCQ